MIKIPKKYYDDLAAIPKRSNPAGSGIHKDSVIIVVVCVQKFTTPFSSKWVTKTYEPLTIYFGIKDVECPKGTEEFWIYYNPKNLSQGYWFLKEEFETYFRIVRDTSEIPDK